MTAEISQQPSPRLPLNKKRILAAAVAVADESGLDALTMRGLADSLDVEAMSLYYHVANKEALLDGIAEMVVEEILKEIVDLAPATSADDWKEAMRSRILRAREVMLRHKWAPRVLESRTTMNGAVIRYYHGFLEVFRAGGMSYDLAHHAMHALGSRALGFSQELFDPTPGSDDEEVGEELFARLAPEIPLFLEFMQEIAHDDPADQTLGWCDDKSEFEFALDLMLDGLDRLRLAD
ncbi:TetR/AcrR family transcriptional regulator C-terminal domain-containing protein [soil metagenome]